MDAGPHTPRPILSAEDRPADARFTQEPLTKHSPLRPVPADTPRRETTSGHLPPRETTQEVIASTRDTLARTRQVMERTRELLHETDVFLRHLQAQARRGAARTQERQGSARQTHRGRGQGVRQAAAER